MTEKTFKYERPRDYYFYRIVLFVLIILFAYIFFDQGLILIENYQTKKMILFLIFFIIVGLIVHINIQINILFKEYDNTDKDKLITLNENDRSLLIQQGKEKEFLIKNEEIELVDIFDSRLSTYPLGFFSYIVIKLKSGDKFIITGNTIPNSKIHLLTVFKGVKRNYYKRIFNRIN
jgi:hypothetical protein